MKPALLILSAIVLASFTAPGFLVSEKAYKKSVDDDNRFDKNGVTQDYTPPRGYTFCALEDKSYTFNQRVDVAYGVNGTFKFLYGVKGSIVFNNDTFGGDPAPGQGKRGYYRFASGNSGGNNGNGGNSTGNILPLGYNWVADENRSYNFNERADVAYGVDGSYRFLYGVSGNITFNNETFGGDPGPGKAKKGYAKIYGSNNGGGSGGFPSGYLFAADEDKTKTFYQKVDLAYGANGSFKYMYGVSGTVTFNNETFGGDPAPNTGKKGYYRNSTGGGGGRPGGGGNNGGYPTGYEFAADEDKSRTFYQKVDLAYGADGVYKYRYGVTGTVTFNNDFFGGDPAPNTGKKGYFKNSSGYGGGNNPGGGGLPPDFVWAADENKSKTFSQRVDVAYGVDGAYKYRYGVTGTITFTNDYFGGDPAPGKGKKGYYRMSSR